MMDKIFLKGNLTNFSIHPGGHEVICYWQNCNVNPPSAAKIRCNLTEGISFSQAMGALEVSTQVTIPQPEPAWTAEAADSLDGVPRLVATPPAGGGIGKARQGIANRVQVRADVQTQMLEIIAHIDDNSQAFRRQALGEAVS
jgi:hypothetical protein